MSSCTGKRRQKAAGGDEKGEGASRTLSPARAGHAHLAAGASSPSRCGPSPRPRALSCRQSSCRLHACKRLQQMRGRGGGGVPRGSSSQATAPLCGIPTRHTRHVPVSTLRRTHARTHTGPPDSQATDSQTTFSQPGRGLLHLTTCLITPKHSWGGRPTPNHYANPNHCPGLPGQAYSPLTEQPPPTKAAKVAAKKLEVNLRLDSAVGEGSSTTPGMHPKTSCWEQRPGWPLRTPVHTGFLLLWFLLGEGEHGGNRHQNRK